MIPEVSGAVKADDLHIFRNPQSHIVEHFYDQVGKRIRHTEDAVEGQLSLLHVLFEKQCKFFVGFPVIEDLHLIRQTAGKTAVLETGFTLVGFIV